METDPLTGAVLLGVLDGHGEMGHIISQYLGNYLRQFLFRHPSFPSKIETAVKECILDAEREIKNNGLVSINFNGTTLCLAVFYNNKVVFANLGDSRAISLGINNKNALYSRQITVDHKPELKNEKMRIEGTGGKVAPIQNKNGPQGPSRVWLPELNVPGLAMSRSFGDSVAHSIGVLTEPEFFTLNLEKSDCAAIIIATDGLWDFVSNEEVAAEASSVLFDHNSLVNNLTYMSTSRWIEQQNDVDDITIAVAVLKNMNKYLDIKRIHSMDYMSENNSSYSSNEDNLNNFMNESEEILNNNLSNNNNNNIKKLNGKKNMEAFDCSTTHNMFCEFQYFDQHFNLC